MDGREGASALPAEDSQQPWTSASLLANPLTPNTDGKTTTTPANMKGIVSSSNHRQQMHALTAMLYGGVQTQVTFQSIANERLMSVLVYGEERKESYLTL